MDIRKIKTSTKKGFLTRDFLVAFILASAIIALFVLGIEGISDEYDTDIIRNDQFGSTYNKLTNLTDGVQTSYESVSSGEDSSFIGNFDVAFRATFTVISTVWAAVSLLPEVTGSLAEDFGFNPTVVNIVMVTASSILVLLLVMIWISSISRGKI